MANLAHAHIGMGDAQAALPYAVHAYRLLPASAVTSDALGWALLMAAPEDKRAVELLEKALTLAPAEPLVQWHLGEAYAATGDSSRAEALLRAAAAAPGFARAAQAAEALRAL